MHDLTLCHCRARTGGMAYIWCLVLDLPITPGTWGVRLLGFGRPPPPKNRWLEAPWGGGGGWWLRLPLVPVERRAPLVPMDSRGRHL